MGPRILFIVPSHDERQALPGVVADLREHAAGGDVVVVNDGSSDGTGEVARGLGVQVLDLPCNLGIGGAVQTGLLFAREHGYDAAVQFDGDGQHRADQVQALLSPLLAGEADVVIGSRFLEKTDYRAPLARRIGIAVFAGVNSLVLRRRITDSTSGFRAYNAAAIGFLAREYPHDYPEPESVVTLVRHGFAVREVPVAMRDRQGGRSSITLWRSIYYVLKVLIAIVVGATRQKRGRAEP